MNAYTIAVTIGPGASKEDVLAEFNKRLSSITSQLKRYRPHYGEHVRDVSHYAQIFQAHDLERDGNSRAAIARQMFPEQFEKFEDNNQHLDHTNQQYQNLIERVTYYLGRAKELINNV